MNPARTCYSVVIKNDSNESKNVKILGGITPRVQPKGITVSSGIPGGQYDDLLIQLFLQRTKIDRINIGYGDSGKHMIGEKILLQSWDASGNSLQIPLELKLKKGQTQDSEFVIDNHAIMIDALTCLEVPVRSKSRCHVFMFSDESPVVFKHGKELYEQVKLIQDKL